MPIAFLWSGGMAVVWWWCGDEDEYYFDKWECWFDKKKHFFLPLRHQRRSFQEKFVWMWMNEEDKLMMTRKDEHFPRMFNDE